MNKIARGQVIDSAAEIYDKFFLPALFEEWPDRILKAIQIETGQAILDVACGTGVLTLAAAKRAGRSGLVVGLDINEGMLAVARRKSSTIEWRQGPAEKLPFSEHSFDRVISQFGLMFFDDKSAAIREMSRVLHPDGKLAIVVWDTLENTPGYAAVTRLLQRLFGDSVAEAIRVPYNLGNIRTLRSLFSEAGLDVEIETHPGIAKFPSLESWLYTDIKGWTLASIIDDGQFELLLSEAEQELQQFVSEDGAISFQAPAHIVTAFGTHAA